MNDTDPATIKPAHPGRGAFLLGLVLPVAGIATYFVLFTVFHILQTPWYMPILATAGTILALTAMTQQRSISRWFGIVFLVALTGFEWFAFLVMAPTPAYAGPAKVGQSFPQFATKKFDGSAFTQENLKSDKNAILLFFRGRW